MTRPNEIMEGLQQLRYAYRWLTIGDLSKLCENERKAQRLATAIDRLTALILEARGKVPPGV